MNFGFKLYFTNKTVLVSASSLSGQVNGNTPTYRTTVDHVDVEWTFEKVDPGFIVKLTAKSDAPLDIERIDSLVFDVTEWGVTDRIPFLGTTTDHTETRYPSELVPNKPYANNATGLFPNLAAKGFAMAFVVPYDNMIAAGVVRTENALSFFAKTIYSDDMKLAHEIKSERVFFAENISISELYDVYREFIPQSSFPMPKLTGWNSWDGYMANVTPQDIFDNLEFFKNSSLAKYLDYMVIDDGWQSNWGDWWENDKFSCGLKHVADKIKEAGFIPGIWMAPLRMKKSAEMVKGHMHWFNRDESFEDGVMTFGDMYCVDPTVPEARQYILDTYKKLYDYGYRLFKIDFLDHVLVAKHYYDPSSVPFTVLRELMLDIRRVTGDDAIILGCSLPVQSGADIAQSMRVGVDIRIHFYHVIWAAETLAWTWMFNNRSTRIDPDFLIVRGEETTTNEWPEQEKRLLPKRRGTPGEFTIDWRWDNGDRFNAVEAETWANLVAISGGNMILSDLMFNLNEKGLAIIENAFKIAGNEARPIYLPDDIRVPSVWKGENATLIINWEDVPATKTVSGFGANATSDKPITVSGDTVTISLLPHESVVVFTK